MRPDSKWICSTSTCQKEFRRKGDLTRHELIHTGTRPYICETCGKGFRQRSALKTHRNVHTGDTPYICGIGTCKKAFGDPSSRSRHRKEAHSREGAYKCVVPNCGTRIKRRSAFVAHLRKHGLDPPPADLNAIASPNNRRETAASIHSSASPDAEDKSHHGIESRSLSPSSLGDGSGYYPSGSGGVANHFTDNYVSSSDAPFDCRRANWSPASDALLPGPMIDRTVNAGPSGHPHDICTYSSGNLEDPFYFDSIPIVDYSLLLDSHWNLPTLDPFSKAGSDGSQSSWSSPLSTYSTLNTTVNSNDDVESLSLADNGLQQSFLYNLL